MGAILLGIALIELFGSSVGACSAHALPPASADAQIVSAIRMPVRAVRSMRCLERNVIGRQFRDMLSSRNDKEMAWVAAVAPFTCMMQLVGARDLAALPCVPCGSMHQNTGSLSDTHSSISVRGFEPLPDPASGCRVFDDLHQNSFANREAHESRIATNVTVRNMEATGVE